MSDTFSRDLLQLYLLWDVIGSLDRLCLCWLTKWPEWLKFWLYDTQLITALSCSWVGIILFYQANHITINSSVLFIFSPSSLIIKAVSLLCTELKNPNRHRSNCVVFLGRTSHSRQYLFSTMDVETCSGEFHAIEISGELYQLRHLAWHRLFL